METTGIDALFAAADISGVSTNVQTLLLAFVAINVLYLGYRFLKRAMGRG